MSSRVGIGFDAHPLTDGRALVLGGVEIPFHKGLAGHSDGDVLVHAIMDALLGAAGLGDKGVHFPSSDPSYLDVSSLLLLSRVSELVHRGTPVRNRGDRLLHEKLAHNKRRCYNVGAKGRPWARS